MKVAREMLLLWVALVLGVALSVVAILALNAAAGEVRYHGNARMECDDRCAPDPVAYVERARVVPGHPETGFDCYCARRP